MKRSVTKQIEEYKKAFLNSEETSASFYASELYKLEQLSKDNTELCFNSLMFGFMVGFNYAEKKEGEKMAAINLSLSELRKIIDTMSKYQALHIETDYEAEEVKERLETTLTGLECIVLD